MTINWSHGKLSDILELDLDAVEVDPTQIYKFAGIYSFGKGLFEREELPGANTSYKYFNRLHRNHITFSKVKGWEGAIALIDERFEGMFLSPQYPTLKVRNENETNIKFIEYFLLQEKIWKVLFEKSVGIGARRNSITEDKFLSLSIYLPDFQEQKRIVSKIESIKNKITLIRRIINEQNQDFNNLRYSVMIDFEKNFEKKRIDNICNLKKGSFPIMKTDPGVYPFVVTARERKTANSYDFDCEAVCVPLVSSTGHGNAAMHRVHYHNGKFALSNLLCAVTPKNSNEVNVRYLFELFMAMKDRYFVPLMKGTSNVSLNESKIGSVEIPIPPIEEQNRIVELLDKFNQVKINNEKTEEELSQLIPSLLDKAFKGEL